MWRRSRAWWRWHRRSLARSVKDDVGCPSLPRGHTFPASFTAVAVWSAAWMVVVVVVVMLLPLTLSLLPAPHALPTCFVVDVAVRGAGRAKGSGGALPSVVHRRRAANQFHLAARLQVLFAVLTDALQSPAPRVVWAAAAVAMATSPSTRVTAPQTKPNQTKPPQQRQQQQQQQ